MPEQKMIKLAKTKAAEVGLKPHEWLLDVALGKPILQKRWVITYGRNGKESKRELVEEEIYVDVKDRIDAAKAAAPFFAPRLATQTLAVKPSTGKTMESLMKKFAEKLPV